MGNQLETQEERSTTKVSEPNRPSQANAAAKRTFFAKHQTIINFWLDVALLFIFLALVWVSIIVRFIFPPAGAAAGYSIWNLRLNQWMEVQFGILAAFFFGIILHLMLHWPWVCGIIGGRLFRTRDGKKRVMDDGQRTIFGVGLMIVLLNIMGIGIALAELAKESPF